MARKKTITYDALKIIDTKQKELVAFMIFTVIVLIVLIAFAIAPMLSTIAGIRSELDRKEQLVEDLDTKLNDLANLRNEYQEFKDELEDFQLIFPTNWDYSLFVANIEEVCIENNFELLSVGLRESRLETEEIEEDLGELNEFRVWSANIVARGSDNDLLDLLRDIESLPTYSTIDSLSYDRPQEDIDDGNFDFSIGIRLYYVQDDKLYNLIDTE